MGRESYRHVDRLTAASGAWLAFITRVFAPAILKDGCDVYYLVGRVWALALSNFFFLAFEATKSRPSPPEDDDDVVRFY